MINIIRIIDKFVFKHVNAKKALFSNYLISLLRVITNKKKKFDRVTSMQ